VMLSTTRYRTNATLDGWLFGPIDAWNSPRALALMPHVDPSEPFVQIKRATACQRSADEGPTGGDFSEFCLLSLNDSAVSAAKPTTKES
jgi:hypothetical protein